MPEYSGSKVGGIICARAVDSKQTYDFDGRDSGACLEGSWPRLTLVSQRPQCDHSSWEAGSDVLCQRV